MPPSCFWRAPTTHRMERMDHRIQNSSLSPYRPRSRHLTPGCLRGIEDGVVNNTCDCAACCHHRASRYKVHVPFTSSRTGLVRTFGFGRLPIRRRVSASHSFVPDNCCRVLMGCRRVASTASAVAVAGVDIVGGVAVVGRRGFGGGGDGGGVGANRAAGRQEAGLAERAPGVVGSIQPGIDAL